MRQHRKTLGQVFLHDANIVQKIIAFANPHPQLPMIEIGCGEGSLSIPLAQRKQPLIIVEVDVRCIQAVAALNLPTTTFVHADALTVDFSTFGRASVIANIPYNITTPLIAHLAQYKQHFDSITIMIQKEVAQRLLAEPGTKQYGAFSIFCKYHFAIEKGFVVSRQCFYPIPGVDSMVIRLLPRNSPLSPTDEARFFSMTRSFFWGRRKTMLNCLLHSPHVNVVRTIQEDIDLTNTLAGRGEMLGLEDHLALFQQVAPYLL